MRSVLVGHLQGDPDRGACRRDRGRRRDRRSRAGRSDAAGPQPAFEPRHCLEGHSTASASASPRRARRATSASKRDGSPSIARAAAAKPARAPAKSSSKCTSSTTCACRAINATVRAIGPRRCRCASRSLDRRGARRHARRGVAVFAASQRDIVAGSARTCARGARLLDARPAVVDALGRRECSGCASRPRSATRDRACST